MSTPYLGVGVPLHVPLRQKLNGLDVGGVLLDDALVAQAQLLGLVHLSLLTWTWIIRDMRALRRKTSDDGSQ